MKIGLALSGGGIRAVVFHLGVLKRIADSPCWKDINFLSTVSGGSLCIALVFEKAGQCWPDARRFSEHCLPEIRRLLTTFDLEGAYKRLLFTKPWLLLHGRAAVVAKLIQKQWGITSNVSQMPDHPHWEICATCYETGKNWRFSKKRMGDYLTNYVIAPDFPLAHAAAASAAVPGVIGPLRIETGKYRWHKFANSAGQPSIPVKPVAPTLTLWDGGVYENLGVEAIFKPSEGLHDEVDFLIVSDASKPLGLEIRRFQWEIPQYLPPFRLINVAIDQVRAFRLRTIRAFLENNRNAGVVLRMGNTVSGIMKAVKKEVPQSWNGRRFLSDDQVENAAGLETTLRKLTDLEYETIFQHGFEVADANFFAYGHQAFSVIRQMHVTHDIMQRKEDLP